MKYSLPILILFLVVLPPAKLQADGGVIVLKQEQGAYVVTVFAEPVPLRAGPVDLSVLVQDKETLAPVLDADVSVKLLHVGKEGDPDWVPPCCRMESGQNAVTVAEPIRIAARQAIELMLEI